MISVSTERSFHLNGLESTVVIRGFSAKKNAGIATYTLNLTDPNVGPLLFFI
jgi:hypothetical protein